MPDDDRAPKGHGMDLNSPLFDRIRVKPAKRAPGKAEGEDSVQPSRLPGGGRVPRAEGARSRGRVFQLLQGPRARIQRDLRLFQAAWTTSRWRSSARRRRSATARPGRWAPRGGAGDATSTRPCSPRRAPTRRRGAEGRRRRGRAAPRYNALALKALFTLELDGQRDRSQDQGALQGAGQAPPPRRQRRRPLVGRQIARDHPGL